MSDGNVINFGDVTQITDADLLKLGIVDVLEGGSPCQSFSVAGLRGGLMDDRGNLALAFADLALRMKQINRLRFVVWENVTGVLSHEDNPFGCLLAALTRSEHVLVPPGKRWPDSGHVLVAGEEPANPRISIAWRVLDAQYFGVPQQRKRVFLIASFDDRTDAGQILFEQAGAGRNIAPSCKSGQTDTRHHKAGFGGITALVGMDSDTTMKLSPTAAFALKASNNKNVQVVIYPVLGDRHAEEGSTLRQVSGGIALDLQTTLEGNGEPNGGQTHICRRLTPTECERLQGFEDGWTQITIKGKPVSDGHRYTALVRWSPTCTCGSTGIAYPEICVLAAPYG
ncbi:MULTISPECIES: DNA cytosine methyltransferase [unclassified Rhizobium]|uniref:DNA cytosine methyltransferase n=1 Tax=unclassified Rhizobium TaxID=2613769 RepID=UPI0009E9F7E4|nr:MULTISPECIES: DNA cytosine methyltransferase [unclassified Rhizobium]